MSLVKKTLVELFELFHNPQKGLSFYLICCDEPVVAQWARTGFFTAVPAQVYHEPDGLQEWFENFEAVSLFGAPAPAVVHLESRATKKDLKDLLGRLPNPLPASACLVTTTASRQVLADAEAWHPQLQSFICYTANPREAAQVARLLALKHLPELPTKSIDQLVHTSLEHYAGDFTALQDHFVRMQVMNTKDFTDALAGEPEVTAFHVVDALAQAQMSVVALRVQQCEVSGIEALSIFFAVVSFLKQYLAFMKGIAQGIGEKEAFRQAGIPFPGERRIKAAQQHLSTQRVVEFFLQAAELEYQLKIQKNAYGILEQQLCRIASKN